MTPPPADTGGALPPGITVIRQTATTIAIEREAFGNPIVYTFALDGSESRNASGAMTMTTRTRWEGDRLVTEGTSVSVTSQGRSVWKTQGGPLLRRPRRLTVRWSGTNRHDFHRRIRVGTGQDDERLRASSATFRPRS